MKTLLIALCLVLAVPAAGAQQNTAPRTPNFYVPYGIRDVPPAPTEMESSSDEMRIAELGQRVNAPPPRPHPMRRRRNRAVQQGHGPRFQPLDSTAGAVVGAVAVAVLIAVLAGGDH
jgi:hypothetical protein